LKNIHMSESRPFSIGVYGPGEKKDDSLTGERLAEMGFVSTDGIEYVRGSMEYNLGSGDIYWGGKGIINGCRSVSQLAGLFYQICGQKIG
jgi:hypothetical protein